MIGRVKLTTEITKAQFQAYVKVQVGGRYDKLASKYPDVLEE